jgi:hypothetical protein
MSDPPICTEAGNVAALVKRVRELSQALDMLYLETADYIRLNHLGPVHHNRSMQLAALALGYPMETGAEPVMTGVDMASGPGRTMYHCPDCGITDYPCNHYKDALRQQAQSDRSGKQP